MRRRSGSSRLPPKVLLLVHPSSSLRACSLAFPLSRRRSPAKSLREKNMPGGEGARGEVLVLTPSGRDAELAASTLAKVEIGARACGGLVEMAQRLDDSTNALLLAEEALNPSEVILLLD